MPVRALWTIKQAAARLNYSVSALRERPDIPRINIAGPGRRAVWRYDPDVIETFIRERTVNPLRRSA